MLRIATEILTDKSNGDGSGTGYVSQSMTIVSMLNSRLHLQASPISLKEERE